MKRLTLFLTCFFISIGVAFAQNKQASGTVTDETGEAVLGASVIIRGATTSVMNNSNGQFSFSVPESVKTPVVKYVGYVDVEVSASTNVRATLQVDANEPEEVVVTAMDIIYVYKNNNNL